MGFWNSIKNFIGGIGNDAKELGNGIVTKIDLGNGVTLELVQIQSGSFTMGGTDNKFEKPTHNVNVSAFQIGKYPVTQAQWRQVANMTEVEIKLTAEPSNFKGDNRPVEKISWYEAKEFCERLKKYTGGREFRLPSEAEWEYASRAGSKTAYCFGDSDSQLGEYAWYRENSNRETHPVGKKLPNAWGLYDMHGNVREWCADRWHSDYTGAPNNGTIWLSNNESSARLTRGGSWDVNTGLCRCAFRFLSDPDDRVSLLGFRVVCVAART